MFITVQEKRMRTLFKSLFVISTAAALAATACAADKPASMEKHFAMMDADKDGKISMAEHEAGAKSMFTLMDANKDGVVTADEMTAANMHGAPASKSDMSAQDKIKVVDTDGDGKLTAAEHATASSSMFTRADTNRDGFLSRQEVAAAHAAMMKKH
jgi:Ca2+-binding EF-hand superfamily protein